MIHMEIHVLPQLPLPLFSLHPGKIGNGPGSHKRHSTWTQKINMLPTCTSPADPAAEAGDLSVHGIYLLKTGTCSFSCRIVKTAQAFCSPHRLGQLWVGRVQTPHTLQPFWRGLIQRMYQLFTSVAPPSSLVFLLKKPGQSERRSRGCQELQK